MERGRRRVLPAARAEGPAQVAPPDRRLRPAQPHRAVLRGQDARSHPARGHRALRRGQAQDARDQDDPQPRQHDALDLRPRAAEGLVPAQPGQARRSADAQEDRDADPVPRPGRARAAPRRAVPGRRVRPDRADAVPDGGDDRPASGRAARASLARRRLRRAQDPRRLAVRPRRVRRSEVGRLRAVGPDGRAGRDRAPRAARAVSCTRATAISSSATRRPASRSTARSSSAASSRRSTAPSVHRITFHELRHTFGTRMAAAGTPMRTLQHWMGHADSKTTQIYAHYQPSDQEADAVDRAFA